MPYLLKGSLFGRLCDECPEPLSGVQIVLYRSHGDDVVAAAVSPEKDTFRTITDGRQGQTVLGSGTIDVAGRFSVNLLDDYDGGPIDIDILPGSLTRAAHRMNGEEGQFGITTMVPRWREGAHGSVAAWEYTLPSRFWCKILSHFGIWTICGRLTTCEGHVPIVGATVKAFDVDWLQDDPLGSAVTDGTGRFLMTYATADFRRTPFSFINIEWVGGPDIYFSADLGGSSILEEPPSAGRAPGRQNIGPGFCVELCSDKVIGTPETQPHWMTLEGFSIHPAAGGFGAQFSAEGYAGGPANAIVFGNNVVLGGNCPLRNGGVGNPLEYRFLVGEYSWTTPGDDPLTIPTVAPTTLRPLTELVGTRVGFVSYFDAGITKWADVIIGPGDLGVDGWIRVEGKSVTVPIDPAPATAVVTVNTGNFLRMFDLFTINTPAVTAGHPLRLPGGLPKTEAGRAIVAGEQEPIRRYQLAFEVRDATTQAFVFADGLSAVIFDNTPVVAALDLEELRLNACNPLANQNSVHILHTVDHPHLRSFSISIRNNTGTVHSPPNTPSGTFAPGNFFFRGGSSGPHNVTNTGGTAVDISADQPCAYLVTLRWITRRWNDLGQSLDVLYCK